MTLTVAGYRAAMANPYSIHIDSRRSLLRFEVEGFWSLECVASFRAELVAALGPLVAAGRPFDLLADLSRYPPQARVVSDQMQESLIRGADLGLRRVACVARSAVTRLQFARVAAVQNFMFFTSVDRARDWLGHGPDEKTQRRVADYGCAPRSTSITAV